MRKKTKKSIFTIHKEAKHPILESHFDGQLVTLRDKKTQYIIQKDGSWRKNENN